MEHFLPGELVRVMHVAPLLGRDKAPALKQGEEREIVKIVVDKNGNQHLDVGLSSPLNFVRSFETDEELPDGPHWCHPSRFVKV